MPTLEEQRREQIDHTFAFGQLGNYPKFPVTKVQNLFRKNSDQFVFGGEKGINIKKTMILQSQSHYQWLSGILENYSGITAQEQVLNWGTDNTSYDMNNRNPWKDFSRFIFELGAYHTKMEEPYPD